MTALRKVLLLLGALAVLRLLVMTTVPVFDPSEARYAAIAANMARTGDYVVPHFTYKGVYQSFDGKPPLVFQAGGLCCEVFGVCEFAVRLFPFLSALLLLWILFGAVRRRSDAETGWLAVCICATCCAFYASAGLAMTDMTLACCVTGSLLLYWNFREDFALRWAAGVAVLLGAGMIVKGPVALALFGVPVMADVAVNRRWRALFHWKWLAVAPLFLVVAVPWFVLVEQRNPGSVLYFFYNENFLRFVKHDYGDKYGAGREAFRGVAVLWTLVCVLPWALLPLGEAARRIVRGTGAWRRRVGNELRQLVALAGTDFAWLALLAITGFWCLTSRVLIYYLFPVIPLFAACLALRGNRKTLWRLTSYAALISAVVLVGAMAGGMLFSDKMLGAKKEFTARGSSYAYEFYHGTHPDALMKQRK